MGAAVSELIEVSALPDLPWRDPAGHKGTFGTVVVVGGCAMMIGAPALTATAALRSGAGLVKIVAEPSLITAILTIQPSATGMSGDELDRLEASGRQVLAVGPGMGQDDAAVRRVAGLWRSSHPMVLDADGLNCRAKLGRLEAPAGVARVVTPHPGEYRRLAKALAVEGDPVDPERRPEAAAGLARALGAVVVLKGRHTVVCDGQRCYTNATGNPALATAGSGDVLTGLIAALMAQGLEPFSAAALATHLHGDAADAWAAAHGPSGLTAMDLAGELPNAFERRRSAAG